MICRPGTIPNYLLSGQLPSVEVLEDAAPGLGQHLRILGLGSRGVTKTRTTDNLNTAYRQYRTVSLVLKIDVASLLKDEQRGPS